MLKDKKVSADAYIQKLVIVRLSMLSPNVIVSLGTSGSFTREQLIENVGRRSDVGEKIMEMQMR